VLYYPTGGKTSDEDGGINAPNNQQLIEKLYYDCKNAAGDGISPATITMPDGGHIFATVNKTSNIGTAAIAFDTIYADDFTNVASTTPYMDLKSAYALESICGILPSLNLNKGQIFKDLDWSKVPFVKTIKVSVKTEKIIKNKKLVERIVRTVVDDKHITTKDEIIETHYIISDSVLKSYLIGAVKELHKLNINSSKRIKTIEEQIDEFKKSFGL